MIKETLKRWLLTDPQAEGFPGYLEKADRAGEDVNDWIEGTLRWEPVTPILEQLVFPLLSNDSRVLELGPGTGRCSRHILCKIPQGRLVLVDHSQWIVDFLKRYFVNKPRVEVHLSNGRSVSLVGNDPFDLIFSNGTFIELKLGNFVSYAKEFFRLLKPGGQCVFDFIDIESTAGWDFLQAQARSMAHCFSYHSANSIDRIFLNEGFEKIRVQPVGKSTYTTFRKPATS